MDSRFEKALKDDDPAAVWLNGVPQTIMEVILHEAQPKWKQMVAGTSLKHSLEVTKLASDMACAALSLKATESTDPMDILAYIFQGRSETKAEMDEIMLYTIEMLLVQSVMLYGSTVCKVGQEVPGELNIFLERVAEKLRK